MEKSSYRLIALLSFVTAACALAGTFLVFYGTGRVAWSMLSIGLLSAVFGIYLRKEARKDD